MAKKAILIICVVLLLFCSCETVKETNDINEYLQIKSSGLPGLSIFPENFDNISKINDYYHRDYEGFFSEAAEIYFDVYYSAEKFYEEINRLENFSYKMHSSHNPKSLIKDDATLFNYTTYVSVFNHAADFEYVCIDETEYRMVYVVLSNMGDDGISVNEEYLPKNYYHMYENAENYKQYFSYNMYDTNP